MPRKICTKAPAPGWMGAPAPASSGLPIYVTGCGTATSSTCWRIGGPGRGHASTPVCPANLTNVYTEWDLHLMCVAATKDLLDVGRNLVIVALVGAHLHIRIFDASGKKVVDKAESELISGEILTGVSPSWGRAPYLGRSYRIVG